VNKAKQRRKITSYKKMSYQYANEERKEKSYKKFYKKAKFNKE